MKSCQPQKTKNVDAILAQLKTQGAMTSGALADVLQITNMGARQHLLRLEKQQLVNSFSQKAPMGRPKLLWQLTSKAHEQFPDKHADLTLQFIETAKSLFGEQGLEQLIAAREEKMLNQYQEELSLCQTLVKKVNRLANIRSFEGYMASVEKVHDDHYLLIENHCPICCAATACQKFCRSELDIFQQCFAPNYQVKREEYLLNGDRRCAYSITSR